MFTKLTIHGRKNEINSGYGDFALDLASKLLTYMNNAFQVPEAIPPKIDLIALPYFPDFSSPSWGLNGFHEDDLFYRPDVESQADKQRVAVILGKEIAHNVCLF